MGTRKSGEGDTGEMMENEPDGRKILDRAKRDIITIERGESGREVVDWVSVCFHVLAPLL